MAVNRTLLQGNLVRRPEMADTRDSDICNLTVASTRKYKDKEDTVFMDCVAYGKTAENIYKFFDKGSPIIVEGRLTQNEWEDRKTGDKRSKIILTVEAFHFAGSTDKDGGGRSSGGDRGRGNSRGNDRDRDGRGRDQDRDRGGRDDSRSRDRGRDDRSRGQDHNRDKRDDPRDDDIPF